jgi:hypothetical protein
MSLKTAPLPPISSAVFRDGIDHPGLWLWDSWTLEEPAGVLNLYCLAVSRTGHDGAPISAIDRNRFAFHVRRFVSADGGHAWTDQGVLMRPGQVGDGADALNVWSGSVLRLEAGRFAFGFTGVRAEGEERQFLQSICVATGSSPGRIEHPPMTAISCPLRDYDLIRSRGYFLGPRESLGSNAGEDGGPILAWRDPFLFHTPEGELHAVWSAKVAASRPAIAHARLRVEGNAVVLAELSPPIALPDADLMTQAEVPKVYFDAASGDYLLLVSACDRRHETQPDHEVGHTHRLYRSTSVLGPWQAFNGTDSLLAGIDGLFGASLIRHNASTGAITVLGPYSRNAGPERQLRFAGVMDLALGPAARIATRALPV